MTQVTEERLRVFLSERTGDPDLAITQFQELIAGWSRITYIVTVETRSVPELPPLIIQVEKLESVIVDSSIERDFQVLSALAGAGLPVPRVFWYEADLSILGGPFLVMERLKGRSFDTSNNKDRDILGEHWKNRSALPMSIVEALVAVHSSSLDGVAFLPSALSGEATAEYELNRCRTLARGASVENEEVVTLALYWLERNCPKSGWLTLIHGDFHMRNLLIDGDRISGIVDWEVTRVSNPLFDLAYMSIPYLSGKFFASGSPLVGGLMPLEWLLSEYGRRTGRISSEADFRFWRVLATLTLLLIVSKGVSDFEAGKLTSIRNAWARFSEPVLHEDLLNLLVQIKTPVTGQ